MSLREGGLSELGARGATVSWKRCEIVHDGDAFFNGLEAAINTARQSVDLEFYIFAVDQTGERIFGALERAADRGVSVRLMVDAIGSSALARSSRERILAAGIQFKVFNETPWARWWREKRGPTTRRSRWKTILRRLNNRNHRKVCIIDGRTAFVGSFNVNDYHLRSKKGASVWRDTGVIVEGGGVAALSETFEEVWIGRLQRLRRRLRRKNGGEFPLVRLNVTRKQRRESYLDLLVRLVGAQRRIWITNAYFVPDGSLLRVLTVAAGAGVDVRILVPSFSDVIFIPWVTSAFHLGLLRAGVKVFEYRDSVLHAKTMVIDDWGVIGSSNLNHRSLLHDLEADIVLVDSPSIASLEERFLVDLERASQVTLDNWRHRPVIERLLGRVLLWFRYVL
jgi:cardiolipin synthase